MAPDRVMPVKYCRHSGARLKAASPESITDVLWNMDSGFAAARRPGMTPEKSRTK
jgi:hypothetical protein